MKQLTENLCDGKIPFCIIQKQDSDESLILTGNSATYSSIDEIPRNVEKTDGKVIYDTISVIPFSQIKERGYQVHDGGEKILTIKITNQHIVNTEHLTNSIPHEKILFKTDIAYSTSEQEYERIIETIVQKEIGNGEGANFVIPRDGIGQIDSFSVAKGLSIFKSLLTHDYGTYWKFIFYDTSRFFIGSTPERHLLVKDGKVKMNPISGTFRKDRQWNTRNEFKKDLLGFLTNQKEINELFMVVDEELKMMAKMCTKGGAIIGPLLKEMSSLIHSEYLLSGKSDKDIFELFKDSMYAATVVGSPVENACKVIKRYSTCSRRYYGSALMLVGRDENGRDFLDSPITIRTAEISNSGKLHFSVGATLVKDSLPHEEVMETKAKSAAILASITGNTEKKPSKPLLAKLYNDDDIAETMVERNQTLSNFWFFRQENSTPLALQGTQIKITLIHNEDDFIYMLQHMFTCMGIKTSIIRFNHYDINKDDADITLLGPGPGNPNELDVEKISINKRITVELLKRKRKSVFICLGHQILCSTLGFKIDRKVAPLQGSQEKIQLFGKEEQVGFYNTFAPKVDGNHPEFEMSLIPDLDEIVAIRGKDFVGYQFHPESILTQNGYSILYETIASLLPNQ